MVTTYAKCNDKKKANKNWKRWKISADEEMETGMRIESFMFSFVRTYQIPINLILKKVSLKNYSKKKSTRNMICMNSFLKT